jgi:undecaprenyl diphosphate synthase
MNQSTWRNAGLHVAIIMDGNGRWATRRGLSRSAGHRAGAEAVRRVVRAAPACGITSLTLYAFSEDNWQRPQNEVRLLMQLFSRFLQSETSDCLANRVRLNVIGRRDRLSPLLRSAILRAEEATMHCDRLLLRVAVDYSARSAIERATREGAVGSREEMHQRLAKAIHSVPGVGDVDLLIRTGGECRLSDFLLWESAYAELYFTPMMWPEFSGEGLAAAMQSFHKRERRFGRLDMSVAG